MHDQPYSLCVCLFAVLRWRQNVARARKLHLSRMRVCQWLIIFSERHCHLWSKTEQTHGIVKSISPDTAPPSSPPPLPRYKEQKGERKYNHQQFSYRWNAWQSYKCPFKYFLSRKASRLLHASNIFMVDLFRQSFQSISWRTKQSLAKGTLECIQRHAAQCDDEIILPWGIKTNALSKSSNSHSKYILESTRFNGLFWKLRFHKTINLSKREWLVSSLCGDEVATAFFSLSGRDINEIHLRIWLMWKTRIKW